MNLMTMEHLTKYYTERMLFEDAAFSINSGEKVGIIGINGTGKSTLLKIATGLEEPDEGSVVRNRNLKIRYLPQNPQFEEGAQVLPWVLSQNEAEEGAAQFSMEADARMMLNRFSIDDFEAPVSQLSGGQRKRLALAGVLLSEADLLILDEPTNHLDSEMAGWLEEFLKNFRGALLMVTHDRYFLDSVTNRIVEIDKGKLYSYSTNYLGFLKLKEEREAMMEATERKRQSILRVEIEWMMRGARARSTKQKAHIARYEELRDQKAPVIGDKKVQFASASTRMGRTTIEIEHLYKSFGSHRLISDFTYIFLKNDRIGIVGHNGCGKSTLMKMIMGIEQPDQGTITIGQTIRIGYFSQENEYMDESMKLIEYVRERAEYVKTADGVITASQMLERFLFPRHVHYTRIEKLSGGEKRRLYLLRVLMDAPNVLILDEPTNDLDIQTMTILEDYLDSFDGIVIAVSHDRYFLDRVTRRIFAFEDNGRLVQYEGGYTDYEKAVREKRETAEDSPRGEAGKNGKNSAGSKGTAGEDGGQEGTQAVTARTGDGRTHAVKLRFTFKEAKEYETIEEEIGRMEERITEIDGEMAAKASDYSALNRLMEEKEALEEALLEKMERWEYLEDLAARIEAQNAR
ncbi:MAG: ABC-F family ATP-binding cassette domain-containing protein [Lachnospiraceae bacterium]|nr:ABC-F family ATP-binding cassette domain-containing protein [Lachnospiraceae bacterium]MDY4971719.1 ABC-F family ATP-binding cassette domain-containing protein [Lachnospiraceae bacterium]